MKGHASRRCWTSRLRAGDELDDETLSAAEGRLRRRRDQGQGRGPHRPPGHVPLAIWRKSSGIGGPGRGTVRYAAEWLEAIGALNDQDYRGHAGPVTAPSAATAPPASGRSCAATASTRALWEEALESLLPAGGGDRLKITSGPRSGSRPPTSGSSKRLSDSPGPPGLFLGGGEVRPPALRRGGGGRVLRDGGHPRSFTIHRRDSENGIFRIGTRPPQHPPLSGEAGARRSSCGSCWRPPAGPLPAITASPGTSWP